MYGACRYSEEDGIHVTQRESHAYVLADSPIRYCEFLGCGPTDFVSSMEILGFF